MEVAQRLSTHRHLRLVVTRRHEEMEETESGACGEKLKKKVENLATSTIEKLMETGNFLNRSLTFSGVIGQAGGLFSCPNKNPGSQKFQKSQK